MDSLEVDLSELRDRVTEIFAWIGFVAFLVGLGFAAFFAPKAPYVPAQGRLLIDVVPAVTERNNAVRVKVCARSASNAPLPGRTVLLESSSGQFLSEDHERDLGESFVEVTGEDGCASRNHWDPSGSPSVRVTATSGSHTVERSYMIVEPGEAPQPVVSQRSIPPVDLGPEPDDERPATVGPP